MIDTLAIALPHLLMVLAVLRLIGRRDLDQVSALHAAGGAAGGERMPQPNPRQTHAKPAPNPRAENHPEPPHA